MGRLVRWLQLAVTNFFLNYDRKIPMKVDSAQYALVLRVPPGRTGPPSTSSLYIDEEDFEKIGKEFGLSSLYPKVGLALSFREHLNRINSPDLNVGRHLQTPAIDTYSRVNKHRGFRTYVGWLIDTVV
jgi:hypothetical protein